MGITNNGYTLTSTGTQYSWTDTAVSNSTFNKPITITKEGSILVEDQVGETTDIGRAAKMFMWWMQTYHPELEFEFDAVEDTKRGIK